MTIRVFGEIEGISEGTLFRDRAALAAAGIHRPPQAGISGAAKEGADSIVLSGGYEDDEDFGNEIIYTGHGGQNDERTEQIRDQELTRQNMALALSCEQGLLVRVSRVPSTTRSFLRQRDINIQAYTESKTIGMNPACQDSKSGVFGSSK